MADYNSILDSMKNAYFDECGALPDMLGNDGLCIKAAASELYNLALEAEYALKQSSYKTATGEHLERIACECGLHRKQGNFATGILRFSIDEPLGEDVTVNKGIICAQKGKKFIQYKTTSACVIKAGELSAEAPCIALKKGVEYNARPDEITVMVNPPQRVQRVSNPFRISNGFAVEDDVNLRRRIDEAIKCPSNALSEEHLISMMCDIDDVLDVKVMDQEYTVGVMVKTYSGMLGEETRLKLHSIMAFVELMGAYLYIEAAEPLTVDIKLEYFGIGDEEEIKKKCCAYMEALSLGVRPNERALANYICANVAGVQYVDVTFGDCDYIMPRNYYVVGNLEVGAYEG